MKEMMRSMSIVSDGAENLVSAEDYLQPQNDDDGGFGGKRPQLQNVRNFIFSRLDLTSVVFGGVT